MCLKNYSGKTLGKLPRERLKTGWQANNLANNMDFGQK
jgi:hypothetical protein